MINKSDKVKHINIAIDGPAGAGKSTIARLTAEKLGYIYIDTGAMYRALAVYFLEKGTDQDDEAAVSAAVKNADVSIEHIDGEQHVFLNGKDVSGLLRTEDVSAAASKTSAYRAVREHLLMLQREQAAKADVIMDGRDIGTAILPDADLKIYLDASSEERAKRRLAQLKEKGLPVESFGDIKREIEERDYRDMHREVSPLKKADDAIVIDSTDMSIPEVADEIERLLEEKRSVK